LQVYYGSTLLSAFANTIHYHDNTMLWWAGLLTAWKCPAMSIFQAKWLKTAVGQWNIPLPCGHHSVTLFWRQRQPVSPKCSQTGPPQHSVITYVWK
jgi:hypothetical protein